MFNLVYSLVACHVLCNSCALLEAAISIVLEQGVSTYYTNPLVQRMYERETEREIELCFLHQIRFPLEPNSAEILILSICFSFMKVCPRLELICPSLLGPFFRKSTYCGPCRSQLKKSKCL